MKNFYRLTLLIMITLTGVTHVIAQSRVSGTVTDEETGEVVPGVNIAIKNTVLGTISDGQGKFILETKLQPPLTLVVSFLGYKTQEFQVASSIQSLDIRLQPGALLGEEVVISASRVEESELKSPVAIEKLDLRAIQETPAPSFYDALENVKGVQMTTSSLTFKVPNTRGFNIPNNFRFVQLTDGVDMQAATLGVPLGNAIGPTELDIESVEITPGAASALYGMNAINGMANLTTKSPFLYQGLSVYQKTGVNHIDGVDYDPSLLSETAIRYAKAVNDRFAFKINGSYLRATDWRGNTATDQNPNSTPSTGNPLYPELDGADHPAYDAWNKYGDDSGSNAVTISGVTYNGVPNQSFVVRRTGYWERDLVPGKVDNKKFDVALHYRLGSNTEVSYSYRYGIMDGLFQRGNKIQLDNTEVQNHKVEVKGSNYLFRSYVSLENTGDSYNLKPLSDNLDLSHRSNNSWRDAFRGELQAQLNSGQPLEQAMRLARTAADAGRYEPGTYRFDSIKNVITSINNWDHNSAVPTGTSSGGAWLRQNSRMYHSDVQYDFTGKISFVDLLVGADFRLYEVIPDGNNFVDFDRPVDQRTIAEADGSFGNNVYYTKYGFFAQATKKLLNEKLKIFTSLRVDQNVEFDPKVNPRIALVYTAAEKHNFRSSYQNGYRFPALFEALSFVNNGNIRRVGGLPYINEGLNYLDNSYTLASVNAFNAAVNRDVQAGVSSNEAAIRNKNLLEATNLATTSPEHINSFEVGYKSVLFDNTLTIDFDAYTNIYEDFLGQVEVSVPYARNAAEPNNPVEQVTVGSDAAAIAMVQANRNSQQRRYRVYTNAKNKYNNYGSSLGVTYNFSGKYTITGNVNYNAISRNRQRDVFVTGFNTPNWFTNISFGNREVLPNLGFNVVYRWQQSFLWESPLANGTIPAYSTVDAQLTYRLPSIKGATVKVGGTNIFNERYIQYAAGPTIGGLYYVAVTVDGLLKK